MKRTLCGLAILAALAAGCWAESSVTLYGVIDEGITVSKYRHQAATVRESSGNWFSTRFGIKGVEDLGGGNQIGFNLQQKFDINTGEVSFDGTTFGYESVLTASGKWGQLAFGRAGALSSDYGNYSILGGSAFTTCFQTVGNILSSFTITDIYNNSVIYISPDMAGLKLHLMYSNGVETDTQKWSTNDHYYGIGLTYEKGNFNADLIWEALDNKSLKTAATYLLNLGASYDFGKFTLYGAYEYALHAMMLPGYIDLEDYVASMNKGATSHAFSLSVAVPAWGGNLMLQGQFAFGKMKDQLLEGTKADFNTWSVGLAYTYPISKRTMLYADVAYGDTGKAMRVANELRGWNATIGMAFEF